MDRFRTILVETDWSETAHAYGDASDAPFRLLALLGDDPQDRSAAVGYLDVAILHQGTVCAATGPVARAVAAILDDARTLEPVEDVLPWDPEPRPLRVALLNFLALVAESCRFDRGDADLLAEAHPAGRDEADLRRMETERRDALAALGPDPTTRLLVDRVPMPAALTAAAEDEQFRAAMAARDLLACRAVAPELFDAVTAFLDDPDATVRTLALDAAVRLSGHPRLVTARPRIMDRLEATAVAAADPWDRAASARLLGMLGGHSAVLLADRHPGVRACAALAPALRGDPRATHEILTALRDPAAADRWFERRLPGAEGWFRFELIEAAIDRVTGFEVLLPAALAVVPLGGPLTVENDWGPLLLAAFPRPYRDGAPLSPAQRAYLSALVDHEVLWDPRGYNARVWLGRAGLPHDRDRCRRIAAHGGPHPAARHP